MKEGLRIKADKMAEVYGELKVKYRWSANDISLRFAALILALADAPFDLRSYDAIIKDIKANTGIFSYYRSTLLHSIAAQLMAQHSDTHRSLQDLLECDRRLKAHGFKNTTYLGIAANALLLTCPREEWDNRASKSWELYQRMKENHFWLTSSDDYAVAVLLAGENDSIDNLTEKMEWNFDALHKEGFRRNNGLQFLSHLLSFSTEAAADKVIHCREIVDFLKEHRLALSSMYYGGIGLLALLEQESRTALVELVELIDYLKSNKTFKWYYKEMNTLMAIALVGYEYTNEKKQHQSLSTTSIGMSLEALIAAQTAAMIAIASSTAAAASASASSN